MANVKEIILAKKIGNTLYDLMVKTTAAMVFVNRVDGEGQATDPAALQGVIESIESNIKTLQSAIGTGTGTSLSGRIKSLEDMVGEIDFENDGTVASQLAAILNETTGIAATVTNGYTTLVGTLPSGYTDVVDYITKVKAVATASLKFKGAVDYVKDLPDGTEGHEREQGDVYQVKYSGTTGTAELAAEYAFNGTEWIELGSIHDLSSYVTNDVVADMKDSTKAGSLANLIAANATAISDMKDASQAGSLANQIATINTTLTNEKDDTVDGSLAKRIKGVEDDLSTQKNESTAGTLANRIKANETSISNLQTGKGSFKLYASADAVTADLGNILEGDVVAYEVTA